MEDTGRVSRVASVLLTVAALVVITAGMRAARELVVPFLLAVFIAILCMPTLGWLRRRGVPNLVSVFLIVAMLLVIGSVLAAAVGMSVNAFVQALPGYQARMDARTLALFDWLSARNIHVSAQGLLRYFTPSNAMTLTESVVSGVSLVLGNGLLILLIVGFILMEAPGFSLKLRAAVGNPEKTVAAFKRFSKTAQQYLLMKTLTGTAMSLAIWVCLVIIGVDYPVLWALLVFLLNFVPYIGGPLATVPPVLLALVQLGAGPAIWTAVACVFVHMAGTVLEPRLLAGGSGLSALVVFLSLIFWGWVLGPIGAVLSVPLTTIVKIAFENYGESRWVAALLGPIPSDGSVDRVAPAPHAAAKRET